VYTNRALLLYQTGGDLSVALSDANNAVNLMPDSSAGHGLRVQILADLGRVDEALMAFARFMALADSNAVRGYQELLEAEGYDPGVINGIWGTASQSAIEACARDACSAWLD